MEDCMFCKIAADKIAAHKVYEDENFMAFLDIAPVNPGHTLVIPKKHYPTLLETPNEVLEGFLKVVQKVAAGVVKGVDVQGFNLGLNNGSVAGQIVPHVHFHIMPRLPNDDLQLWRPKHYEPGEAKEIATKIRKALGEN